MANTKKSTEDKSTTKKTTKKTNTKVEAKKTTTKKVETVKKVPTPKKDEKIVEEKKVEEKIEMKAEDSKNGNVAKGVIITILLVIFFIVIITISDSANKGEYNNTPNNPTIGDAAGDSSNISEDEMADLKDIGITEYLDLKKNAEKYSIIYIGRPTCSHCEVQKPIMQHMVYKYNIEINYLDTDKLDNDELTKFQKSDDYFSEGWGTPLVLIVKDDKIVDKSEGETSIEELTEMFKEYGLISE